MLGYSSVMHMGYIFLGIAALNVVGLSGAALLMFAHGLSIAALFAMAGHAARRRRRTLAFDELRRPRQAAAVPRLRLRHRGLRLASACPASPTSPANSWSSSAPSKPAPARHLSFGHFQLATIFALWGVVISAVYMLRAYRADLHG